MTAVDRGVLYGGILLTVVLSAVSVIDTGHTEKVVDGLATRKIVATYDTGPISITQKTNCIATPGAYYAEASTNTQLQWGSPVGAYTVTFPAGEDPSNPGSGIDKSYAVPAGGYSQVITIAQTSLDACNNYGQCVYYYKISPPIGASCMGGVGTFGIIVRP